MTDIHYVDIPNTKYHQRGSKYDMYLEAAMNAPPGKAVAVESHGMKAVYLANAITQVITRRQVPLRVCVRGDKVFVLRLHATQ